MKYLIVFGAGNVGRLVCTNVLAGYINNFDNIFLYDNDVKKQTQILYGYYVLSSKEFNNIIGVDDLKIIIATDYWQEILNECKEKKLMASIIAIYTRFNFNANQYLSMNYGQDSEDAYLREKIGNKTKGFYVDIGAHHPMRFSNTYWAYLIGWNGINIEPNEDLYELLNKYRERDINLNCGVSNEERILKYYKFGEPAFNTFCTEEFEGIRKPIEIKEVQVYRLSTILEKYNVKEIDILNIDVEGLEEDILISNNWDKYTPKYIIVEQKNITVEALVNSNIYKLLIKKGYNCEWKNIRSVIYRLDK